MKSEINSISDGGEVVDDMCFVVKGRLIFLMKLQSSVIFLSRATKRRVFCKAKAAMNRSQAYVITQLLNNKKKV